MMIFAAVDAHYEIAVVRMEREAARRRRNTTREKRFKTRISLSRRMEAAPFDIGPENDTNLIADVVLSRITARHFKSRGVIPFSERNFEHERRRLTHAARHIEFPAGGLASRIGYELYSRAGVKLARVALALKPAAHSRPDIETVRRAIGVGIGGENRIVLARDHAPAEAHLRGGTRAVRKNSSVIGIAPHLFTVERYESAGGITWRRYEEFRNCSRRLFRRIYDHFQIERAALRSVSLVYGRFKFGEVLTLGVTRSGGAERAACIRIDEMVPEVERG